MYILFRGYYFGKDFMLNYSLGVGEGEVFPTTVTTTDKGEGGGAFSLPYHGAAARVSLFPNGSAS